MISISMTMFIGAVAAESLSNNGAELGCFYDTRAQSGDNIEWALSLWTRLRLTVADCHELCSEYRYFALQYGQGTEVGSCFCGNSYAEATRYGPADNCEAGTGGPFSNSLYRIKETSPPSTSPTQSPTLSTESPTDSPTRSPTRPPSSSPTPLPTPAGLEEEGFVLIQQHRDVANGYFSSSVSWSGVENEHDPEANTFCIIGNIDPADYRLNDGRFWLKLIYRYDDDTVDTLEWTQTSWITDTVITGADLFGVVDDGIADKSEFQGLTKTPRTVYHGSYLDGTDSIPAGWHYSFWYHAIACWDGQWGGIPAHNGKFAMSSSLWIKQLERVPLQFVDWSWKLPDSAKPLSICQGDCSADSDCEIGLKCVHDAIPNGCDGSVYSQWTDYCGDATVNAAATFDHFDDEFAESSSSGSRPNDALLKIIGSAIGAVFIVAIVVVFLVSRSRRNAAKSGDRHDGPAVHVPDCSVAEICDIEMESVDKETPDGMASENGNAVTMTVGGGDGVDGVEVTS